MDIKNKNILILGYGKSGQAVLEVAIRGKANAYIFDKNKKIYEKNKENQEFLQKNVFFLNKLNKSTLKNMNLVVLSPSYILKNSFKKFLLKNNIKVISELEFGYECCPCPIFAITGTNGKTTTSTLLYNIISSVNDETYLLGNSGVPLSKKVLCLNSDSNVVCEVSSYQLEYIENFKPKVASILNLGVDHIAHHKTLENYYNAKLKIFDNMGIEDFAVINYDDKMLVERTKNIKPKIFYFSLTSIVVGSYIENGIIKFNDGCISFDIAPVSQIKLLGKHNLSNILCATTMALLCGVSRQVVAECVCSFTTLAHRLEFVKISNGITYINDSKATNIESTMVALDALKNANIILLLGGLDKGEKFSRLFCSFPTNIKTTICFGSSKNKIYRAGKKEGVNILKANYLKDAILLAESIAHSGDTILLSPACASFDEFNSFEHRGDVFKQLINN